MPEKKPKRNFHKLISELDNISRGHACPLYDLTIIGSGPRRLCLAPFARSSSAMKGGSLARGEGGTFGGHLHHIGGILESPAPCLGAVSDEGGKHGLPKNGAFGVGTPVLDHLRRHAEVQGGRRRRTNVQGAWRFPVQKRKNKIALNVGVGPASSAPGKIEVEGRQTANREARSRDQGMGDRPPAPSGLRAAQGDRDREEAHRLVHRGRWCSRKGAASGLLVGSGARA